MAGKFRCGNQNHTSQPRKFFRDLGGGFFHKRLYSIHGGAQCNRLISAADSRYCILLGEIFRLSGTFRMIPPETAIRLRHAPQRLTIQKYLDSISFRSFDQSGKPVEMFPGVNSRFGKRVRMRDMCKACMNPDAVEAIGGDLPEKFVFIMLRCGVCFVGSVIRKFCGCPAETAVGRTPDAVNHNKNSFFCFL